MYNKLIMTYSPGFNIDSIPADQDTSRTSGEILDSTFPAEPDQVLDTYGLAETMKINSLPEGTTRLAHKLDLLADMRIAEAGIAFGAIHFGVAFHKKNMQDTAKENLRKERVARDDLFEEIDSKLAALQVK